MNLNKKQKLFLCLWLVFMFDSCGASFPKGTAYAAETCAREVNGTVESAASMFSSGEAFSLVVGRVVLNPEPGNFKAGVLPELVGKTLEFHFLDKICRRGKYDKVTKIVGYYLEGPIEISWAFLNPEQKVLGKRR